MMLSTMSLKALAYCGWWPATQTADIDLIEKYGVLGLLYIVLGAIGVFLIKKGDALVGAVEKNTQSTMEHTAAMRELTSNIATLVRQHDEESRRARDQIDNSTKDVMGKIDQLRDDVRRRTGRDE